MKERGGGSIICTACVAGLRAGAGGPAYSASKAGVISLVEVAATQLVRRQHPGQRHLPGPDRNRHDPAALRHGPRRREGRADRPPQPDEARRRAGRDRPCGAVPGLGRVELRQRPCIGRRRRPFRARTRITSRNMDARPFEPDAPAQAVSTFNFHRHSRFPPSFPISIVIPAKAGIHLPFTAYERKEGGPPLSRG